ncbi:hypothetical protein COD78_28215 [Bacillus cereus]|uniref:AMP-dependent synthetase/ligase domain-containing protein n=1 Tax=Bacillus cereus TaxID=1396 RepID=A0A9X6ZD75_BACCE|nr:MULTISPECIES: class I adenylate-forming enzyme family protein [Bacillus cereus group]EKS7870104.1 acyl--CoA ligase [Bacillus cereus]OTW86862.1 hypothetical protein BK713_05785 [Bacillus thuringiensis serovar jinghongiensis]OTX19925.1 hypothetical protein BK715_08285 [Bacillus thuringiensis serovar japonensis]PDZ75992.1 hypothetical protein CON31_30175 [Bacillus cereus]PEC04147.1 hypothetical protein COM98_14680 [Bacillus cereus]
MMLTDLLLEANKNYPNKLAIYSLDSAYTYNELLSNSIKLSKRLSEYQNSNVIIHSNNSAEYAIAIFSLLSLNSTIIPVSVTCSENELSYILKNSNCQLILVDEFTKNKYSTVYQGYPIYVLDDLIKEINDAGVNYYDTYKYPTLNQNNKIAFIIYSSGSTGEMKGIKCTHEAICFVIHAINQVIKHNESDNILCVLPFSFDYGLYQVFIAMEAFSTIYVHTSLLNPLEIPNIIQKQRITGFPAMPLWLSILIETKRLNKTKLQSLRYITSTGDVLKPSIIDDIKTEAPGVRIFPMYGLTECKRVSILPADKIESHTESVGLPLSGTSVRIVDDIGNDVPIGEIGELVVSGPHLMDGYYGDDELTNERYRYNNKLNILELYTGDLFKKDKDGFLYFISRTQFFIKRRGQRISPVIIEELICRIEDIKDSVIVPVRTNGEELVVCFIRKNDIKKELQEIASIIKQRLPNIYNPDFIFEHQAYFPFNNNGKINRRMLIKLAIHMIEDQTRKVVDTNY